MFLPRERLAHIAHHYRRLRSARVAASGAATARTTEHRRWPFALANASTWRSPLLPAILALPLPIPYHAYTTPLSEQHYQALSFRNVPPATCARTFSTTSVRSRRICGAGGTLSAYPPCRTAFDGGPAWFHLRTDTLFFPQRLEHYAVCWLALKL